MSTQTRTFAHRTAVDVYGAFLEECVDRHVLNDRAQTHEVNQKKASGTKIDGRPIRLVTISGKGGWTADATVAQRWQYNDNISLLDHLLSVARGALMFWLADAPRAWSSEGDRKEIERLAYAVVGIAFLHDIDKDLGLKRGEKITAANVEERMSRYGIDRFLSDHHVRTSPDAMLNYIEEVEGTQGARSPAAPDYNRRIAATCRYIELADKLDGAFTSTKQGDGIDGALSLIGRWPTVQDGELKQWQKVEIQDHLHVFLLDRFQRALSGSCKEITGSLPLIEIVHDGRLLCVIPQRYTSEVSSDALERYLSDLPYGLRLAVNNRLACEFVGGAASWDTCRDIMNPRGNWDNKLANLLALPKAFARSHHGAVDDLLQMSGMESSWGPMDDDAIGATVKVAIDYPGGDSNDLDMEPSHALAFLTITLNHKDGTGKSTAPSAAVRERELVEHMKAQGKEPPEALASAPTNDARARRAVTAIWVIGEIWRLANEDRDEAQDLLDTIVGRDGLVGLWIEGNDSRAGLASQIRDTSSDILHALRERFTTYLSGRSAQAFDPTDTPKRCILCNEPVDPQRRITTASRAHGIKSSAFSGRDGRNDHLTSPSGDTHVCLVCLAELQLRQDAQDSFRGSNDLPPLISSPVSTGLFGGLAFEREPTEISMGLHDLNRFDRKKGPVYKGLDCQMRRIRVARLEALPNTDRELVTRLQMTLKAISRLGRPIHIFRGAPRRHPGIFYFDAMPTWLEQLLGGSSLRIEQIPEALAKLDLFAALAEARGLGIEWARQLADPDPAVVLGAVCVAWAMAADKRASTNKDNAWSLIENKTRERALVHIRDYGGTPVKIKDNQDPLIRLAWLATRVQKRIGIGASVNKQLLCWKTALEFYAGAAGTVSTDDTALILGLASTLEEELTRKGDAAAGKHREGQPLDQACIDLASHFANEVWAKTLRSKEPASQEQRRAAAIYRFALLEAYRERGIPEAQTREPTNEDTLEA